MDRTTYSLILFIHAHLHTSKDGANDNARLVAVEEMIAVSADQQARQKVLFLDDAAGNQHSVAVEEKEHMNRLRVLLAARQYEAVASHAACHGDHMEVFEGTVQEGCQK